MIFQTILMLKVILAQFLSQKSWPFRTLLSFKLALVFMDLNIDRYIYHNDKNDLLESRD